MLKNKHNYILSSGAVQKYILDNLTGWVLALSLYLLTNTYKGRCVRVRRDDDVERDFYFYDGFVTVLSILNFVGSGDGYVCNLGNQYALGNEAVQATAASQPKIVESGSFLYNGVKFDGTNDWLSIDDYAGLEILTPPLTLYFNTYTAINHTGYMFTRIGANFNDSQYMLLNYYSSGHQIAFYADDTPDYGFLYGIVGGFNTELKSMYAWTGTGANEFKSLNNTVAESAVTFNATLNNKTNTAIACRNEGGTTPSTFYRGQVKSLLLFNTDQYTNYDLLAANC